MEIKHFYQILGYQETGLNYQFERYVEIESKRYESKMGSPLRQKIYTFQ